ncbi:hypothetical protein BVC80_8315g7 [Macleaya cordata]|uniref:Uncharacterized protein n=1 Tax=Macleaya cordata TaxID=56857 RepID=A0A200QUN7_MACCD|nr:hypothetical protein BVC80_8315g7 [Macleaya cordata]
MHLKTKNSAAIVRRPLFSISQQRTTEQKESDELVVEQLRRTKANVSVWGLLEASIKHKDAVLEALNSIQVPTVITPNELVVTVTHIHSMPTISFLDEDLPSEGARHNRALNITIGWNHLVIPLVLIDNGFGVNICTLEMAKLMGLSSADLSFEDATVRTVK